MVFREDIVTKMCRNCVKFPADNDVPTHVSLLTQLSERQFFNFPFVGHKGLAFYIYVGCQQVFKRIGKKTIYFILSYFLQSFLKFDNILKILAKLKPPFFYVGKKNET